MDLLTQLIAADTHDHSQEIEDLQNDVDGLEYRMEAAEALIAKLEDIVSELRRRG
jgi:hypothetical protein